MEKQGITNQSSQIFPYNNVSNRRNITDAYLKGSPIRKKNRLRVDCSFPNKPITDLSQHID
jgi:hypothetical protein